MSYTYVENTPNPSAIPFKLDGKSFMGGLGAVVISRDTPQLATISSFAGKLFSSIQELAHMHVIKKEDGDLITLSGHANKWMSPEMALMEAEDILEAEISSGVPLLNEGAVRDIMTVLTPYTEKTAETGFKPKSGPDKLFREIIGITEASFYNAVTPVLERDGGAIDIEKLEINFQTGAIKPHALLVASCFGCGGQGETLHNAFNALQAGLELFQSKHKGDSGMAKAIQNLRYEQIIARDVPLGYAKDSGPT